jgi:hypothetical protein
MATLLQVNKETETTTGLLIQQHTDLAMVSNNERFESSFPKTVIVKKTVED